MKCCTYFIPTILIVTSNTVNENLSENDFENSDDQAAEEYELADESYQSNSKEDNLYSPSISSANINKNKKKLEPVLLADLNKAALEFFSKKKKTNIE